MRRDVSAREKRLLELPLEFFELNIDYNWNEKWGKYSYSNSEKTGLVLKDLKRAMELREDVRKLVFDKLSILNSDDMEGMLIITEFMESLSLKKMKVYFL